VALGLFLAFAGTSHLTWAREEFRAQVPPWVPVDEDAVVLGSGVVEIALGTALLATPRRGRRAVGKAAAAFFVAIFPGNVSQYLTHTDGFGLDTDRKRDPPRVPAAAGGVGPLVHPTFRRRTVPRVASRRAHP
jgi:hypothetical protein